MKIGLALTACNRPGYLRKVIKSLRVEGSHELHLFINVEPVEKTVVDLCQGLLGFASVNVVVNKIQLGNRHNTFEVTNRAFNSGMDYVIYCEDDVVFSKDYLELTYWYIANKKAIEIEQGKTSLSLNFFTHRYEHQPKDLVYIRSPWNAWGAVFSKDEWYEILSKWWFDDNHNLESTGFDWSINGFSQMHSDRFFHVAPCLSRSYNIGRDKGTYSSPEHWEANMKNVVWFRGRKAPQYKLVSNK